MLKIVTRYFNGYSSLSSTCSILKLFIICQSAINRNTQTVSSSIVDCKVVRATAALTQLLHEDVSTTSVQVEQFRNTLSEAVVEDAHVSQELLVNKEFQLFMCILIVVSIVSRGHNDPFKLMISPIHMSANSILHTAQLGFHASYFSMCDAQSLLIS